MKTDRWIELIARVNEGRAINFNFNLEADERVRVAEDEAYPLPW